MNFSKILKAHRKHLTNPRSEFLSELMKVFGSECGGSVISAFKDNDIIRFRKAMVDITNILVNRIHSKSMSNSKN